MMKRRRFVSLCTMIVVALFLTTSCGPIMSTSRRADAEDALQEAADLNAAERAPYEYTLAQEYLRKSNELWGYSQFGASAEYAQKSIDMAHAAAEKAKTNPWKSPLEADTQKNRVIGNEAQ